MALPARWVNKIQLSDLAGEIMELQMGPSHPASHGTIKFNLKLDGERIIDCDVETLSIGDRVEIVWEHVNEQMAVFRFRPITT